MPGDTRDDNSVLAQNPTSFPSALLDWAGNRGGGVRRLFDDGSGRPGGVVIETNLVSRLKRWAASVAVEGLSTPRIVMLVGGPGNGKTEAIEATLSELDRELACDGQLIQQLAAAFHPKMGQAVPRRVSVEVRAVCSPGRQLLLDVVQDASVGADGVSPAELLVAELDTVVSDLDRIYLCCVNRGVLDNALIHATDTGLEASKALLEAVVHAVSLAPDASSCWPLNGYPDIAVWPMDAESLVEKAADGEEVPAASILDWALDGKRWPEFGSCAAGQACPFCGSRKVLSGRREIDAFVRMLRWYELGSGKRWAFRDLFSLASFLLAGNGAGRSGAGLEPCGWAASLLELDKRAEAGGRPSKEISSAIFSLVAAQYQHALFHRWDGSGAKQLSQDIKDVGLGANNTAMGLYYFLHSRRAGHIQTMIAPLLETLIDLLDPALASPDSGVVLWGSGGNIKLAEFDARFSRSVREGLDFAISYRALSLLERMLLERLADLDELLSTPRLRRKRPTSATRIQRLLRDFAGRIFRRSVGARQAVVPDTATLVAFQRVVADADGKGYDLREIAKQVEDLLNQGDSFQVSLTTTFGQPLPPLRGRAMLVVGRRRVSVRETEFTGRPRSSLCFLDVEVGSGFQPIALTYDLFKAVRDLDNGLSSASLPRNVLALLDTTRARMAGSIVRDRDVQERPTINLGDATIINRYRGQFVSGKKGGRR